MTKPKGAETHAKELGWKMPEWWQVAVAASGVAVAAGQYKVAIVGDPQA